MPRQPKPLTPAQDSAMRTLSNYRGQTVQVQTSQYTRSGTGAPLYSADWKPVDIIHSSVLRSLETRGLIRIDLAFWRGANVTVL